MKQVQNFMEPSRIIGAVGIFEDNKGAIKLAVNKHASRTAKHIDVKHHLVRDACDAGKVRVVYVWSPFMAKYVCQNRKTSTWTCSASHWICRSLTSIKTQPSMSCDAVQMLGYTVNAAHFNGNDGFLLDSIE